MWTSNLSVTLVNQAMARTMDTRLRRTVVIQTYGVSSKVDVKFIPKNPPTSIPSPQVSAPNSMKILIFIIWFLLVELLMFDLSP